MQMVRFDGHLFEIADDRSLTKAKKPKTEYLKIDLISLTQALDPEDFIPETTWN